MRRHTSGITATILALSAVALACSAPQSLPVFSPGALPVGEGVLRDQFDNNNLGWDNVSGAEGATWIENGKLKINIKTQFAEVWSNPSDKFPIPDDVIIEVKAENTGSPDNYFGVLCRYQDLQNFYFLVVSSDGYYGIGKVVQGKQNLVNRTEMPPSEVLKDLAVIKLRAECTGKRLALFVNGKLLDEQEDTQFTKGTVGLIAGNYKEEVSVLFDDFEVYKLKP